MSFASGTATFNSCNKAGSIVEFTNHLRNYPNDYDALMWRSRAYDIVGQPDLAMEDIEKAISVSSGVKRENAIAKILRRSGAFIEYGCHVIRTVAQYPNEWTALKELAQYYEDIGNEDEAYQHKLKVLDLATKYNETRDPSICWTNYDVGYHLMRNGDFDTSRIYLEAAVDSCPTYTLAHIQLCRCNIIQGNISSAKQHFQTAKSINPDLASKQFQTENFEEYFFRFGQQIRPKYTSVSEGGATGGSGGGNWNESNDGDDHDDNNGGDNVAGARHGGTQF